MVFFYYLDKKGESEFTAIEAYCWNLFNKNDTKWIPSQNTLLLQLARVRRRRIKRKRRF